MTINYHICSRCRYGYDADYISGTCPEMGTDECEMKRAEKARFLSPQQKPLPEPAVHFDRPESMYPDTVRLSFPDGHTEIYDRRVKQPSPRKYLNMPNRRRKQR